MSKHKELWLSCSAISDWNTCQRMYYWRRIRKLKKIILNIPFLTGRLVHHGIFALLSKAKDPISEVTREFNRERNHLISSLPLDKKQEEEIVKQGAIVKGIIYGYARRYHKFIRDSRLISNEEPFHFREISGVVVVGKIDNVLENHKKDWLYELKTTKYLTAAYVQAINVNFQSSLYFHVRNTMKKGKKLAGVLFDVIRKPSIRQKKKESPKQFLARLEEWYNDSGDDEDKFHLERIHEPVLSANQIFTNIEGRAKEIKLRKEKEDYLQDFGSCYNRKYNGKCEFFDLCHAQSNKEFDLALKGFKKTESHHVKEEKEVDD